MKRTKQSKNPDLILCADFHLRESQPICRTDDFWQAQWNKVDFIRQLQIKYNCPVIHSGDLFEHWKPSPYLLTETIRHLPNNFRTIYGNHDLPQHSVDLAYKCGVNTLKSAGLLEILPGCHWLAEPSKASLFFPITNTKILVWHIMTYKSKLPWPGCTDPLAAKLLKKYPEYDLIVTGHNHQSFVLRIIERFKDRILVNPGSLTRHKANQIDHKPCVYLWYAENNHVEPVYLPIKQDVIIREYIDQEKQQDERMKAFISRLDDEWEIDEEEKFEKNLERFAQTNQVSQPIMDIVLKAMEL